ncbi:MAG TPA: cyclase family protein [Candidatus Babeliales bacterium]|nr:cyclase family protein [Candidatus Babeliales bacterium]
MKKIIDISWPLFPNMSEYKDRRSYKIMNTKQFESDGFRETVLSMNMHTGTHIDAPSHFLKDGKKINEIDITQLWGPTQVIDLTHIEEKITKNDLIHFSITENSRILLKTKNSFLEINQPYTPNFIYLELSGANYLAERKVAAIGIDYLGIERNQADHQTHKLLFDNNIIVLEGIRLREVTAGNYDLICCPLNIIDAEASPARAFLVQK